jgi:hypothetical protein
LRFVPPKDLREIGVVPIGHRRRLLDTMLALKRLDRRDRAALSA